MLKPTVGCQGLAGAEYRTITKMDADQFSRQQMAEKYIAGRRSFERIDLREAQLKDLQLSGALFCWADFTGVSLCRAQLDNANFTGAMMWRAQLQDASFRWANLHQTVMVRCDAAGANFTGANLHRTDLRLSNLRRANFAGADLRGAKLSYSDLRGADLTGTDLTGADLTGTNLTGARMEAACWQSTLLQRAQLDASFQLDAAKGAFTSFTQV